MQICCSICKDLFIPHSEVSVTKCGHLYHENCIGQWSAKNQTCPQCRAKLKEKPHRVYFDVENDTDADPSLLQYKIDKLLYNLQTKNGEITELNKKIEGLEAVRRSLKQNVVEQEEKAQGFRDTVRCLKSEIKTLVKEKENLQPLKQDNEVLKAKIESMEKLQAILQGTESEVQKMLQKTPVTPLAVHQLCIYVEALKQQLKKCEEKYKVENRQLQHQYMTALKHLRAHKRDVSDKLNQTVHASILGQSGKCSNSMKRHSSEGCSLVPSEIPNLHLHKSICPQAQKVSSLNSRLSRKVINNLEKNKISETSDLTDVEMNILPGPSSKRLKCARAINRTFSMANHKGTVKAVAKPVSS